MNAVQAALAAGRIQTVAGQVDSEKADADWDANTDHGKASRSTSRGSTHAQALAEARTERERLRHKREQLEYDRDSGVLVRVTDVEATVAKVISLSRTKILGLPAKIKGKLPNLTPRQVAEIDQLVREALEELADVSGAG